ncbi:MAG: magnesium transporter [Gemmatimonadetes bacterium]|nr:magnesium transporter [Gemmatimonadota bacterium]
MSTEACFARLAESFSRAHPADAARGLESLPGPQVIAYLSDDPEISAGLLGGMPAPAAARCIEALAPDVAAAILQHADPDQAAYLLHYLNDGERTAILSRVSDALSRQLHDRLSYPVESVGAVMRMQPPSIADNGTILQATEGLRRQRSGGIPYAYAVDGDYRLTGVMSLMALLHAAPGDRIEEHLVAIQVRLTADLPLRAVIDHAGWRRYSVLPVVDADGRLVGGLEYRTLLHHWRPESRPSADSVAAALGELYQLGISGMLQIATGQTEAADPPAGERVKTR